MGSRKRAAHRERLSILLRSDPSDDELARVWTLSASDLSDLQSRIRSRYRLGNAIQLCALLQYGRFLENLDLVSPRIASHLADLLGVAAPLKIAAPLREATRLKHQGRLLELAEFRRFDGDGRTELQDWLTSNARAGQLPDSLVERAELYLLRCRIPCPASTTLERLVVNVCASVQTDLFERIHRGLSPELRDRLDQLLSSDSNDQRSFFQRLKESPPSATVRSINRYLERYEELELALEGETGAPPVDSEFASHLANLARIHTAWHLKGFRQPKRFALMIASFTRAGRRCSITWSRCTTSTCSTSPDRLEPPTSPSTAHGESDSGPLSAEC